MSLRRFLIAVFLLGAGLLAYSFTLPYYSNQTAVDDAMAKYIIRTTEKELSIDETDVQKKIYYDAEKKYSTAKRPLQDTGSGLVIASLVLLLFSLVKKVKTRADIKALPALSKVKIFIYANIASLLSIPGTIWYYTFRMHREDYPWFADTIAIPISTENAGHVYVMAAMNVMLLLVLWKAHLPTEHVFVKAKTYGAKAVLWEIFFTLLLVCNVFIVLNSIIVGDHVSVPTSLCFTWLFLNLRAGHISKY